MKSPVTTHILDTHRGRPASGVLVRLERKQGNSWTIIAQGQTNGSGRIDDWVSGPVEKGQYRIVFETGPYLKSQYQESFYPEVVVEFLLNAPTEHYHIPLLLSGHGYSTYRGS